MEFAHVACFSKPSNSTVRHVTDMTPEEVEENILKWLHESEAGAKDALKAIRSAYPQLLSEESSDIRGVTRDD